MTLLTKSDAWKARPRLDGLALAAGLAALVCAAPAAAVIGFALAPGATTIPATTDLLRDAALGTLGLMLVGGGGAIALGACAGCIVSLCDFPGRRAFTWLLVTPLAAPAYVLSYAYSSLTWAGGPAPWPVTGFWGAAFIYAVALYPYVFLATRAAFARQSARALEAARTLGAAPGRVIWQVALPMARPGVAAGAALALMEVAADYGAAQHFGVTTLSTAIFRAWYAHGSTHAALQIASLLLVGALVFLLVERGARGRAAFTADSTAEAPRYRLSPAHGLAASAFCAALAILGAGLPLAWLLRLTLLHGVAGEILRPLVNSLALASAGTLLTLLMALVIAAAARRARQQIRAALFAASVGYAAPGAVIAMGALALFGAAREAGWVGGFGAALAVAALLWTYAARFTAAGVQPIEAGFARLSKGVDASARLLGAGAWRRLAAIDAPIAAPSIAAAALILFSEILKELPATLILRPFNFDTLAVSAYAYASDERLLQAAGPSLLIFLAGVPPILLLAFARRRKGARS